jgi:hypothetical protein
MSLGGLCARPREPEGSPSLTPRQPQNLALDSEQPEPYMYSTLNEEAQEIRLLTLLPSTFTSEVRLCLDITPFTEFNVPKFEAVSYTWGSPENLPKIFIGETGRKTLAVTQNLAEALPYFRYEDKPRVLWIDAICVNQQDLEERSQQVKRMADIFSKAARVLVWLGPESDDSLLAIDCLEKVASKVKVNWEKLTMTATTDEAHWTDLAIEMPLENVQLHAINHLIQRPWFERLWIRQEVLLASGDIQVMCGGRSILWEVIRTAVYWLFVKRPPWFAHVEVLEELLTRRELVYELCISRKQLLIDELVHMSKSCVCSDPRDKVYALLSLLFGNERLEIDPDYTKNVYDVYRHATLSLIGSLGSLRVLNTVECHEDLEGVPSWVPIVSKFLLTRPSVQIKEATLTMRVSVEVFPKMPSNLSLFSGFAK